MDSLVTAWKELQSNQQSNKEVIALKDTLKTKLS